MLASGGAGNVWQNKQPKNEAEAVRKARHIMVITGFGFSLSAIRHWEAHRHTPEGAARVLLMVIQRNPEIVLKTLHG